jgi:hypothetical protein
MITNLSAPCAKILIDTSLWIRVFRDKTGQEGSYLQNWLSGRPVVYNGYYHQSNPPLKIIGLKLLPAVVFRVFLTLNLIYRAVHLRNSWILPISVPFVQRITELPGHMNKILVQILSFLIYYQRSRFEFLKFPLYQSGIS